MDDGRAAKHRMAILDAGFGDGYNPRAVLVGAGLHGQIIVEGSRFLGFVRILRVCRRRVETDEYHFNTLQPHDPVGFGPAPVVADAHADDAAERAPYPETGIARLEVFLLQMLEGAFRIKLVVAGQVGLAVRADNRTFPVDED